jgi:2-dehydropantoate 2-reductase
LHLTVVQATDDPAQIGVVDVIFVAVKATQVATVAVALRPLLGPTTLVIPLQNGVEASGQLAQALGTSHVAEGLARVIVEQSAPGQLRHLAVRPILEFGPRHDMPPAALARGQFDELAAAIQAAGMVALQPSSMPLAVWEKFLFIEPFGTVGAATRQPLGTILAVPETYRLLVGCMHEICAVASAGGVTLDEQAVSRTLVRYAKLPVDSTASMQRDLIAGRPSEFELQTGAVVRLGLAHGVPTPLHDVLYAVLRPIAANAC